MLCYLTYRLCKSHGAETFYVVMALCGIGFAAVPFLFLILLALDIGLYVIALILATFCKTIAAGCRNARPIRRPYVPPAPVLPQPPTRADLAKEVRQEYDDKIRVALTIPDVQERSMTIARLEHERRALLAQLLAE
jgi:hypothetical protein